MGPQLLRRGDDASTRRAAALIEQSATAMAECEKDIFDLAVRPNKLNPSIMRVYYFYWMSSETWLAQAEIARDLGRHEDARSAFQHAKKAFDCLAAFSEEESLAHERSSEFEALRKRVVDGLLARASGASK